MQPFGWKAMSHFYQGIIFPHPIYFKDFIEVENTLVGNLQLCTREVLKYIYAI